MSPQSIALLKQAASDIESSAEELRRAHTLDDRWDESEVEAKRDYCRLLGIARLLRKEAYEVSITRFLVVVGLLSAGLWGCVLCCAMR